ncbi:hypothetical protein BA768_16590 [Chryseobacterium sp. CBo1]|nr:hypothetical protein BA768_16590 [Chryseobacterium sp. CBo1]
MQKLANTPKIGTQKIRGVSPSEITKVENKLNIKFPLAYKEFLLLAGEYTGGLQLFDGHSTLDMLSHDEVLGYLKETLKGNKLNITRPFWVISEYGNFDQFTFFYLDENTENPNVWGVTYRGDDEYYIYPLNKTFSEYISSTIDKSIHFSKYGY